MSHHQGRAGQKKVPCDGLCFVDFDMIKSHDLRDIALSHHQNGGKAPEIAKLLANKVHRYRQSGSIGVKPKSGRPGNGRSIKCTIL
jgi:hypothetical protein